MAWYRTAVGIDYTGPDGIEHRTEPGESTDQLPAAAVQWLLDIGAIELVQIPDAPPAPEPEPVAPAAPEVNDGEAPR